MATKIEKDPDYLKAWFGAFAKRHGERMVDCCIVLYDGGWDGSESVSTFMREYDCTEDEARDMLDYLAMMTVEAKALKDE